MTSPRTLLRAWNITAKKKLGQNFLADPSAASMIVDRSGIAGEDVVLEIGAGLGALTVPLARRAYKVFAVEKDFRLTKLLKTELTLYGVDNVVLLEEDFLKLDIDAFIRRCERTPVVMGNLPYSISSQILIRLISARKGLDRAVLMFQKELAERLIAPVGSKDYGRITVILRYCATIKSIARLDSARFFPRPHVDSEVLDIKFKTNQNRKEVDEDFLFQVIKAAFGRRRKTVKNSLAGSSLNLSSQTALEALDHAGIDPSRRAETLEVEEFIALSHSLATIMDN
jgi:16S rRNA (adenine1518-N6/adenine1519-N6)-dimethyltransferase